MKYIKSITAAAIGLALSVATSQAGVSYGFTSVGPNQPGVGGIQFGVNSFQFNPVAGAVGTPQTTGFIGVSGTPYFSFITSGPWTIGSVSGTVAQQTASVTGGGTFEIYLNAGNFLTGNLTFGSLTTKNNQGLFNDNLAVNVTGITLTGNDPNLKALFNNSSSGLLQFNWTYSGVDGSLGNLVTGALAGQPATYSGSFNTVPEPSTVVAGALLLLPFGVSTIRILRKNKLS